MMRRLLRAALVAWFGYPGRALLIAASLSALVTAAGFTVLEWQARATTLQAETTRRLAEQWAADGQLRPAELVRDAHIVRAVQQQADGAITAMAEHTPLPPAWLPLRPLNWRAGPERLHLDLAPMNRAELLEHAVGAIGTALPIALFVAMLLALWVQRPLTALQDWLLALDQGRLGQKPPPGPWPLHQITDELGVLAERLRHTRAALQERHNASERGHQATIRRLQQELARIHQEQEGLAAMGDSRGELLRTMSHEMRTPLTAIIGYADLLGRNDPSPEAGEYAGIISRSARNLLGMINNLLDLARIEAGALEPQSSEFDVSELIEDTVALLAPLAFDKRLELNTLIYHDVPPRLRGDALRIAQILTNLLSNAIKYTDAGEVIVRLMQERRDADVTLLRLEVEDTGRGLADDQKQKLFQAWRRFEVAGSKASGSGLGLAIVHKLLDVLDGDIQVQSTPGKGSLFIARVPCRRASATRGLMRWDALRGVRLWVCEPQATTARALSHLLTFWEVEFRFWSHPAELQDALEDPGSAVMADALLLGMDADNAHASALNDIMSLPAEQRPPTLVLVPSIDATTHQQWRDRGAQVVLAKGSPRAALYDALGLVARPQRTLSAGALDGQRVLVADNNRTGLRILQTQMQKLGASVDAVESGAEAVALWEQHTYALALIDYQMPGMNGLECARAMRASPFNLDTPLLGMSAWIDPRDEEAWRDAGVDTVLVKPFDMDRLLRVVRQRSDSSTGHIGHARSARGLLDDPEMADLLREELPRQWQELDAAFIAGERRAVRDAAHQLHGTAAFLHLQPLQDDLALFERTLADSKTLEERQLPELMSRVQQDVRALLAQLHVADAAIVRDEAHNAE